MKISTSLRKASAWLQTHRWVRGRYFNYDKEGCRVGACALGVLRETVGNARDTVNIQWFIQNNFLNAAPISGYTLLTQFNDNQAKSKKDIIALFNLAADYAEAQGL